MPDKSSRIPNHDQRTTVDPGVMTRHSLATFAIHRAGGEDTPRRRLDGQRSRPAVRSRRNAEQGSPAGIERQKRILGLNVTKSQCDCLKEIPGQIKWAQLAASVYDRCGKDPKNKTGTDVESCFDADMKKRGIKTSVAGTTSASGKVKINKTKGTCGRLWDHATKLHEKVHAGTQRQMVKTLGKNTPAFNAAWNKARNWGDDEVKAYGAEIPFYQAVAAHLRTICQKGGDHGGALLGGIAGATLGAGIGAFGGPIGALVGGAIGALGGALLGSLFD